MKMPVLSAQCSVAATVRGIFLRLVLVLGFSITARADDAKPWRWEPSLVPRALVVEGLWSDFFLIEPAMHSAGLRDEQAYISRSPYFGGYSRLYHMPKDAELNRFSVIVIANLDAPTLKPERLAAIREFVSQGGGLVVLGGYWAFSRGAYEGTPLAEMLPVTFPPEHRIPPNSAGLPLRAAPGATWKMPFDFSTKPSAFYVQSLVSKPGATVQIFAGDKPAMISGTFGKGRVVACALTANGEPPKGVLPFWDWPDFPKLLGVSLDWVAGARPLVPDAASARVKPTLSDDEMNSLALGSGVTPELARRICEHPDRQTADALFSHVVRAEGGGKVDLAGVFRALLPFAKTEWGAKLRESLEKFSPDIKGRQATLILLGATKDPAAYGIIHEAVQKEPTKDAAIEAFGWLENSNALPLIRELLARAKSACKTMATEDEPRPDVFARQQGSTISESAIALFRLGDPDGVSRILEVHRRVRLYDRIFHNAIKRRVRETDAQGIGILRRLNEGADKLATTLERLREQAGPVPESQRAAFIKAATNAIDPADVEWLCLAMEQSASTVPGATWQPLTMARDGTIARMAAALISGK